MEQCGPSSCTPARVESVLAEYIDGISEENFNCHSEVGREKVKENCGKIGKHRSTINDKKISNDKNSPLKSLFEKKNMCTQSNSL